MADSDGATDVLKEIRDEIRGVRTELEQLRGVRATSTGIRTERLTRLAPRWQLGVMSTVGALSVIAIVLSLRSGGPVTEPSREVAPAPVATHVPAVAAPAPAALPASAPVGPASLAAAPALKPALKLTARPATLVPAVAVAPKRHVRPEASEPTPPALGADGDEAMAYAAPRRVRVHRMSYSQSEPEPAKL